MRLSCSSLEAFENCPAKFKFQVIDKIKTPKSKEAIFGSLIHETLKLMHEPSRPIPPTEEEILRYFNQKWQPEIFEDKNEEIIIFQQGLKILKNYYAQNHPSRFNIIGLEISFGLPLNAANETHLITGKIDRADKTENGIEIIDYKTAKKMLSQKSVDDHLQLAVYHLGLIERWPSFKSENRFVKASLYFLKHSEKISTLKTPAHLAQTQEKIIKIIEKISACQRQEKFEAQPNPLCDWCGYQPYCPFFKHKFQQEKSSPDAEQIKNLINEYLELKSKEQETAKKSAGLKKTLNEYCDQSGHERLFGEQGYITRLTQQRYTYDPLFIRQALEPLNKWDEVIAISPEKLKKIIKELPPPLRQKINEAKKLSKEFKVWNVKYVK